MKVTRESGPPHMKTFLTRCKVGDMETEAEGNSKKVSKKKAAELMLEKLKELPALPPSVIRPRTKISKKKNKNIIKVGQNFVMHKRYTYIKRSLIFFYFDIYTILIPTQFFLHNCFNFLLQICITLHLKFQSRKSNITVLLSLIFIPLQRRRGHTILRLSVCTSVWNKCFCHIFLSNCWWQSLDFWRTTFS